MQEDKALKTEYRFGETVAWIDADKSEFLLDIGDLLGYRKYHLNESLNESELVIWALRNMWAAVAMDGFSSLFEQLYSLRECKLLIDGLREMKLCRLADLFAEALLIYVWGNVDITEEQYQNLDIELLPEKEMQRFEELESQYWADDCEEYQSAIPMVEYIQAHYDAFAGDLRQVLYQSDRDYLRPPMGS